jgi:uncharacterized membrane protein
MEFLTNPLSFPITLVCILLLISTLWSKNKLIDWVSNNKRKSEVIFLCLLLLFAFLLRINGYTRYSAWTDELYSSCIAANPHLPWINVIRDPGQPPLYYFLLRIWFIVFGWSEASGRMLSVIIGTLGILTLYYFVKMMCGRKYAFFVTFLLAINTSHIFYSNEIRMYVFLMTLVPLVSQCFFLLLRKENLKNYLLYILLGALTVNTHYYGILFICANFTIYIYTNRARLFTRPVLFFLIANITIAISFMPFFLFTALSHAWQDNNFNSWISKPDKESWIIFIFVLIALCFYIIIKRYFKAVKNISKYNHSLIDYVIYVCSFIFIAAFIISLERPILQMRYLTIILPLLFSIFPILIFNNVIKYKKLNIIFPFFMFTIFAYNFRLFVDDSFNIHKEVQAYITADINTHPQKKVSVLYNTYGGKYLALFYNFPKIELYSPTTMSNIVYVNVLSTDTFLHSNRNKSMLTLLVTELQKNNNSLKIKTTLDGEYIYKIYLK